MRAILTSICAMLLCGCTSNLDNAEKITNFESSSETTKPVSNSSNFSRELEALLPSESIQALHKIRQAFNEELVKGHNNKDLQSVYTFHAKALRYDLLNQERFGVFPYTRPFYLSELGEAANHSGVLTNKCGFFKENENITINYYCLDASNDYFDYLANWGKTNSFIDKFQKDYQESKTLTPKLRQLALLEASEQLDFSKVDHQLFYMLIQICNIEEQLALHKLQSDLSN